MLCIICQKIAKSKAQKVPGQCMRKSSCFGAGISRKTVIALAESTFQETPLTISYGGLGCMSRAGWAKTDALGAVWNTKYCWVYSGD